VFCSAWLTKQDSAYGEWWTDGDGSSCCDSSVNGHSPSLAHASAASPLILSAPDAIPETSAPEDSAKPGPRVILDSWWCATSANQIAEAARSAGVYLGCGHGMITHGAVAVPHVPITVVTAHHGPWLIYPLSASPLGWGAQQAHRGRRAWLPVVGKTVWLGGCDIPARMILDTLLESTELPVAPSGNKKISTRHAGETGVA
jgi:hypothetical protein